MRAVALALIRRNDEILVERGYDTVEGGAFFRLLGGTIEFGELGADAVRRELREELGIEIEVGPRIATIENIFTWEGRRWHEIALVYECLLDGAAALPPGEWQVPEEKPTGLAVHELCWKVPSDFATGRDRLYPVELLALLGDSRA
jgi:ADP-ribose pyrophosphatase YjhB (NUDIX family)